MNNPSMNFRNKPILLHSEVEKEIHKIIELNPEKYAILFESAGGLGKSYVLQILGNMLSVSPYGSNRHESGYRYVFLGIKDANDPGIPYPVDLSHIDRNPVRDITYQLAISISSRSNLHLPMSEYFKHFEEYNRRSKKIPDYENTTGRTNLLKSFIDCINEYIREENSTPIIGFDTCEHLYRTITLDHLQYPTIFQNPTTKDLPPIHALSIRDQFLEFLKSITDSMNRVIFSFGMREVVYDNNISNITSPKSLKHFMKSNNIPISEIDLGDYQDEQWTTRFIDPNNTFKVSDDEKADIIKSAIAIANNHPVRLHLLNQWLIDHGTEELDRRLKQDEPSKFYREILENLFDLSVYLTYAEDPDPIKKEKGAFGFCLICLAYGRCGVTLADLEAFLESLNIGLVPETYRIKQYLEGRREEGNELPEHALIKKILPRSTSSAADLEATELYQRLGDLLYSTSTPPETDGQTERPNSIARAPQYYLHDQLWIDLDSLFNEQNRGNVSLSVYRVLGQRRQAAIQQLSSSNDWERCVELMCDHLTIKLWEEASEAYAYYISYADQALRQGDASGAIMLSETFWRTVTYETLRGNSRERPILNQLVASNAISPDVISHDELVLQARLLNVLSGQHVTQGEWPDRYLAKIAHYLNTCSPDMRHKDRYLYVTFGLAILELSKPAERLRALHNSGIPIFDLSLQDHLLSLTTALEPMPAEQPERIPTDRGRESLLLRRRHYLIAETHRHRSAFYASVGDYRWATAHALACYQSLEAYEHDARKLNDGVDREQAIALINLAIARSAVGITLDGPPRDPLEFVRRGALNDYDTTIVLARSAIVRLYECARKQDATALATALWLSEEAQKLARAIEEVRQLDQPTGVRQVEQLAWLARSMVLRAALWMQPAAPALENTVNQLGDHLADSTPLCAALNHDIAVDLLHEVARAHRDYCLAQLATDYSQIDDYLKRAWDSLADAERLLSHNDDNCIRRAAIGVTRVSLYSAYARLKQEQDWSVDGRIVQAADQLQQLDELARELLARLGGHEDPAPTEALPLPADLRERWRRLRFEYVLLAKIAVQRAHLGHATPSAADEAHGLNQLVHAVGYTMYVAPAYRLEWREIGSAAQAWLLPEGASAERAARLRAALAALPKAPPSTFACCDQASADTAWSEANAFIAALLNQAPAAGAGSHDPSTTRT